jgi:hypothetical protein
MAVLSIDNLFVPVRPPPELTSYPACSLPATGLRKTVSFFLQFPAKKAKGMEGVAWAHLYFPGCRERGNYEKLRR